MTASRAITFPSMMPPSDSSTWSPACTLPWTRPSIRITPSASRSPVTVRSLATIERPPPPPRGPDSGGAPPPGPPTRSCDWSSTSTRRSPSAFLLHQHSGIDRDPIEPDLEMQMRGGRAAGVAALRDHLAGAHLAPLNRQNPGEVPVHGLVPIGMLHQHEIAVFGLGSGLENHPASCSPHHASHRDCDIDAGVFLFS